MLTSQLLKLLLIRGQPCGYQTPQSYDFHFLAYNGFLQIFRPLVLGGFWRKKKSIFFGIFLTSMYRSSDLAGSKHDWS